MLKISLDKITPTKRFSGIHGSEFQFEIRVAGNHLLKGDKESVEVIFGNLDGKNFRRSSVFAANKNIDFHGQWLTYMSAQYGTSFEHGTHIAIINPDGELIEQSAIQNSSPK